MVGARKRAKPGDVLEVDTPRGLAYIQYAGKHERLGDAIRILPGFFQHPPQDVRIAASFPLSPGQELPSRYRKAGWTTREGKVTRWFIVEGKQETARTQLSPAQKGLFIADIWNHEFLVGRLVQEWRPEHEE